MAALGILILLIGIFNLLHEVEVFHHEVLIVEVKSLILLPRRSSWQSFSLPRNIQTLHLLALQIDLLFQVEVVDIVAVDLVDFDVVLDLQLVQELPVLLEALIIVLK